MQALFPRQESVLTHLLAQAGSVRHSPRQAVLTLSPGRQSQKKYRQCTQSGVILLWPM